MASAAQLKALLKAHLEGDESLLHSVAMQIAAHEAKLGHGKLAQELRGLIDEAKRRRPAPLMAGINQSHEGLGGLLELSYPKARLGDIILTKRLGHQIHRIVSEQRHAAQLLEHGLTPRSKLLLVGLPGTGKTLTASILAGELGLPLFAVRLDSLITKFMGETASKLRQVFDSTDRIRGVYFFDEFDAIGPQRGLTNDVGEIRRVLNSLLQMIEQCRSHSMVLAATNHPDILDSALFRRFDDVLHFDMPGQAQIVQLLKGRLANVAQTGTCWNSLGTAASGLSYADVTRAANDVLKDSLIEGRSQVLESDIRAVLEERLNIVKRFARKSG